MKLTKFYKLESKATMAIVVGIIAICCGCIYTKFATHARKDNSNNKKSSDKKIKDDNDDNSSCSSVTKTNVVFTATSTLTRIEYSNGIEKITSNISQTTQVSDELSINNGNNNDIKNKNLSVNYNNSNNKKLILQTTTVKQEYITIEKVFNKFVDGLQFGKSENQGTRERMENVCDYIKDFNESYQGIKPSFCLLLFDGHAGVECAQQCKQNLPNIIANEFKSKEIFKKSILYCDTNKLNSNKKLTPNGSSETYTFDENDINNDPICESIKNGFIKMDKKFKEYAKKTKSNAGAVGVFVLLIDDILYCANIGDARAVISREGKPVILTEEHTPSNVKEKERAGAHINENTKRLCNELAVTRAFGDYIFNDSNDSIHKMDGLVAEPHITKLKLTSKDEFCIIACDGLWDVIDNKNAIGTIRRQLRKHQDCNKAATVLVDEAMQFNTTDNVSAMVLGFANKNNKGKMQIVKPIDRGNLPPGYKRRFINKRRNKNLN
mmetsp:Transcript_81467/g.99856  ORF Transcript_81467/g.99856 Transcript_81467/m.99856 type:complete len:494 (+) Transcript_81467:108-1589(+)